MIDWAYGIGIYNSNKNDCLARLSPLPNSIDSYLLLTNEVIKLTSKTHNNACALLSSLCIAQMIFLGNNSYSRDEIKKIVDDFYQFDYQFNLNDLRENMHYDEEIKTTIGVVLYSIFNTDNFDDAIRLCLSIGGDTDTNCAIVGSIAESLYGMNETQINDVYNHLNDDYKKLLICKKYVN
jgi:ADP-ribosylglycohydrolase